MRKRLFRLVIAGTVLFSQRAVAQTPKEINTKIETSTGELYTKAALWGTTFISQYNGSQDYSVLKSMRIELQEYIDDELAFFKEVKDVNGSAKLNSAVIAFYEFEKKLVANGFQPFEKLNASSGDEQINSCRTRLKEEAARESEFTTAINNERKTYAAANNISMDPPPAAPKPQPKRAVAKPVTVAARPSADNTKPKEPVKKAADKTEEEDEEE